MLTNYASQMIKSITEEIPGISPELAQLYALLALVKGTDATLEDVHDAWSIWTATVRGQHKSLIPFIELTQETQELDRKYMEAIHRAAK